MNPFDIGIRLCGREAQYMVDDIPAVTANLVHALKEDNQQSFSDFFDQIKESSYKTFLKDLELELLKRKRFKYIISETSPYSGSQSSSLITNEEILGYRVELPYHKFTEYQIKGYDLNVHKGGKVQVKIIDLVGGGLIYSKDFTVGRGRQTLKINHTVSSLDTTHIFVGINVLDATLYSVKCDELTRYCDLCCDCEYDYGKLEIKSECCWDCVYPCKEKSFCLNATIRCNLEKILEEYSEFFGEAFKYKMGIEILNYKIHSDRIGWFINSNSQIIRESTIPELRDIYYKFLNLGIVNISDILNDTICWSNDGVNSIVPFTASLG